METVITVKEVGIDWITATANEVEAARSLACIAEAITDLVCDGGYKRAPWTKWGYVGETARFVSWGRRGGETCVVLSSWAADNWFTDIVKHATNVSRIDLAVTVHTEPMLEGVARRHYGELISAGPGGRCNVKASIIENTDGGSTAYVGRRISNKWLRIYDKQRESADEQYAGCWRYELECKRETAMDVVRDLCTCADRTSRIKATVHRYCVNHGIKPIYTANSDGLLLLSPRPPTDIERQCEWLSKQVAGTAQEVVGAIGLRGLLGTLGLDIDFKPWSNARVPAPHGHHSYEDDLGES